MQPRASPYPDPGHGPPQPFTQDSSSVKWETLPTPSAPAGILQGARREGRCRRERAVDPCEAWSWSSTCHA